MTFHAFGGNAGNSLQRCVMTSPLGQTIGQVIVGGGIVFALGIWLGRFGTS